MEQQSQYQYHYSVHGGQMAPMATHAFSSGRWWSKMSLRALSIVFNVAIVGFSAYYYTKWTVGALLMLGPPVSSPSRGASLAVCTTKLLFCVFL